MAKNEKRMAGDYEVIRSIYIGDNELILGENKAGGAETPYMTAYC